MPFIHSRCVDQNVVKSYSFISSTVQCQIYVHTSHVQWGVGSGEGVGVYAGTDLFQSGPFKTFKSVPW